MTTEEKKEEDIYNPLECAEILLEALETANEMKLEVLYEILEELNIRDAVKLKEAIDCAFYEWLK